MPSIPPVRRPTVPSQQRRANLLETASDVNVKARTVGTPADIAGNLRKRRTGIRAVGVAIIIAAGSVLGAQLKTSQQQREHLTTTTGDDLHPDAGQPAESIDSTTRSDTDPTQSKLVNQLAQAPPFQDNRTSTERNPIYNQRQISFLEDRRGVLLREKLNLEQKIERVREKRRKEEEMEHRRKIEIANER